MLDKLNRCRYTHRFPLPVVPIMHRLLISLYLLGIIGFSADLYLLEHYETWYQRIPLIVLAAGGLVGLAALMVPRAASIWLHRVIALGFVVAGVVGLYLHYQGNAEFELELYPSMAGSELFWESMSGATPALAPFGMSHLGLLGLLSTYRHPRLRRDTTPPAVTTEEQS